MNSYDYLYKTVTLDVLTLRPGKGVVLEVTNENNVAVYMISSNIHGYGWGIDNSMWECNIRDLTLTDNKL